MAKLFDVIIGSAALLFGAAALAIGIFAVFQAEWLGAVVGLAAGLWFTLVGWRRLKGGRSSTSWRDDPATERQKAFADELGIDYPPGISKGEMSDLISQITGR